MKIEGKNILIISNEPWGDIWFSKHNYAFELSKKNKVFFINPTSRWSFLNLFRNQVSVKNETGSLFSIHYYNFLPFFFFRLNNQVVSSRIRKKLNSIGIEKTFFWSFDPARLFRPDLLAAEYSLFEAVDKYRLSLKGEKPLYSSVDSFVIISEDFRELYGKYGKPILTVSHALSKEEFNVENPKNIQPLTDNSSALYIGNVDYRLDFTLIRKMAEKFPQIRFVFIGGITDQTDKDFIDLFVTKKFPNVIYTGKKHFKELKFHIASAKFCIAPMRIFKENTISHHKIFQYLALGKPVFSCEFSEYKKFNELLYMENESEILMQKMSSFILSGELKELTEKRIKIAQNYTFDSVISNIESFITANESSDK